MRYPPVVALINAVVSARTLQAAMADVRPEWSASGSPPTGLASRPALISPSRLRGEHRERRSSSKGNGRGAVAAAGACGGACKPLGGAPAPGHDRRDPLAMLRRSSGVPVPPKVQVCSMFKVF